MNSSNNTTTDLTFKQHIHATIKLGFPLVLMQITFMLIGVTDTIMLGWLGVTQLAAGVLAFQMVFIALIFGLGLSAALMPLVSEAAGRNDTQAVRRSVRMGLWVLGIVVILLMFPLFYSEAILIALGQDPELAALAQTYIDIAQWSLIPAFLLTGLRNFLASLEHTRVILIITILMAVLNAVLNYALIFGHFGAPRLGLEGAAISTVVINIFGFISIALYIQFYDFSRPYEIFKRFWVPEGWIGTLELAAHGIALQITSVSYMIPLGLSQAASVRVGNAVGRSDREGIRLAAKAVMALSIVLAMVSALIFLLFPELLIQLFLDDENQDAIAVLKYAIPLLYVAATFQIFDTIQAISSGNLRGLKDTKVPMIMASISYWPVGLTVGYILAFPAGLGGVGVWLGLVVGLAVASFLLTLRFNKREELGLVKF